jgi:phytoene dehydrogenase-like protein
MNDTIIVGGGLSGLAAATLLARAGKRVTLFEKAQALGGRAVTHQLAGGWFNLGPHALYRAGKGAKLLRQLGVPYTGSIPSASGNLAMAGGKLHGLPSGLVSMLSTSLLTAGEKLEAARVLAGIARIDLDALEDKTVAEWTAGFRHRRVRELVHAMTRVTCYANAPELMSAAATLRQLRLALAANVLYLDGGWRTLVEGLRSAAEAAGVRLETGQRVGLVRSGGVQLHGGAFHPAASVMIAGSPHLATELTGAASLQSAARELVPVRAACLDLLLTALPRPRARFALGIDQPLYLSVHSATAKLAPEGRHVLHAAKYLAPDDAGAAAQPDLEAALDLLQPGWRAHEAGRRFLPEMTVAHAVVTPKGRPDVEVRELPGVYVAGDWVGPEGMLADAALASSERAAERILRSGVLGTAA